MCASINGLHSTLHRRDRDKRLHLAGDRAQAQNAWSRQLTRWGERVRGSGGAAGIRLNLKILLRQLVSLFPSVYPISGFEFADAVCDDEDVQGTGRE